jgi:hypothetical protein
LKSKEDMMKAKILSIAAVAGLIIGTTAIVQAEEKGSRGATPGHEMQEKGSLPGQPGASGYAPGHSTSGIRDRDDKTTGQGDRDDRRGDRDDRMRARDRDDRKIDKDDRKLDKDGDHDKR